MKKKKIIIFIAVISFVAIGFLSIHLYWFVNPEVTIRYSFSSHTSIPSVSFYSGSIFGLNKDIREKIKIFSDKNDKLALPILQKYDAARKIIGEVKNVDEGTMLIYDGWGMPKNGTAESFHEECLLDFILTENIEERGDRAEETSAWYIYPDIERMKQDMAIEKCRIPNDIIIRMNDKELAKAVADYPLLSSFFTTDGMELSEKEKMLAEASDAYRELKTHNNYTEAIKDMADAEENDGNTAVADILRTLVK